MQRTLSAVAALLVALVASGCIFPFCGPTTYHLSAVTASVTFEDEAWNATRAAEGLRAAGFGPRARSEWLVEGWRENVTMGASGSPNGTRVFLSFSADERGSAAEVARAGDAVIERHRAEVEAAFAAFAAAANWTIDSDVSWDRGVLHGDC